MRCNNCGTELQTFGKYCHVCGAPASAQPSQYAPPPAAWPPSTQPATVGGPLAQTGKTSFGCGKIILIVAIILVLIGGGLAAAVYFGYTYAEKSLKSSDAYMAAVAALKRNPEVNEKLGEIQSTGFPLGWHDETSDGSGRAKFTMSIEGTKTSGRYNVDLLRRNNVWRLAAGTVTTHDGTVIDIANVRENATGSDSNNANNETTSNTNQNDLDAKNAVSGGVLNTKAISLPKPPYPPIAKAARVSGTVVVRVLVDEKGDVISARAVSGHPLLQAAAVAAARQAKFPPREISGKPVKVSGTITYNFVLE